ncbi:MAG: 5-oxoprolinase subunit PxpA [Lachnospiraceae bacterium]|nr:5-oxoprolinase subunit PxpA [Lachnospiraceae bacterium]
MTAPKTPSIDLNCDLGESFGNYKCGMDEEILPCITSANVACGFHASDPLVMQKTVRIAGENHVHIGAHPGFQDLVGFGRRSMSLPAEEITAIVEYQIGALSAFCTANGVRLQHVKPHGALYNMAVKDSVIAEAICEGIAAIDKHLILLGPAHSQLLLAAEKYGLPTAKEFFADRAYEEDGTLVPRSKPGAVIGNQAEAIGRVIKMIKEGTVTAITGKEIPAEADSICIHGDNPAAVAFARSIHDALQTEGIRIAPMDDIVRSAGGC